MEALTLCMIATVIALLVVLSLLRRNTMAAPNSIPGPWGFPIVGHLPMVNLRSPFLTFTEWQKSYGPLMKVNMGGQEIVIVSGYDAIKELLLKKECNSRPDLFRINQYRQMGGFGFSEPNSCWKSLRKAVHTGIRSYGPGLCRMNRILNNIQGTTQNKIAAASLGGGFDPWPIVYSHMLRSITAFTLGENVELTDELYDIVERLDALAMQVLSPVGVGAMLDSAPWLRHLGHPTWKKVQELLKVRDELWAVVKPGLEDADVASIAQHCRKAQADNKAIDDERIKCTIGDMMIAGSVSTSVSTYCLLQLLCHHPNVQKRIQQEIHTVLGSSASAAVEDMDDMPYTRATIMELQRFVSVTPLGLPHCNDQACTLAGIPVPKGTNLLPNLWSLHRDAFWSKPNEFQPERFLAADNTLVPADHPNRRRMLAFGVGPRLCPGESFSYSRIFMLITHLLKNFSLAIDPASADIPFQPDTFSIGLAIEPNRYRLVTSLRQTTSTSSRSVSRQVGEA